jgi:uncharacterized protein (TIRG00374 family)
LKSNRLIKAFLEEDPNNRYYRRRNQWIIYLSMALAVLFLYLTLKGLDWESFWEALGNAQYEFLPIILVWGSITYFIRAMRWRILLSADKEISYINAFWANMSGYLGNNFLPARAGELIRAVYVNRVADVNLPFALAGGLSERLIDVIALILLGSMSLTISGITSRVLQRAIQVTALAAGVGTVIFLILPKLEPLLKKLIEQLPLLGPNLRGRLSSFLEIFMLGLRALLSLRRAAIFSIYTAAIWLMDGLGVMFTGFMLHLSIKLPQAFILLAGLGLSSAVPSTPGYIGVYQFVAVTVLEPFGVSRAQALAFIITSQILNYVIIGFYGFIALLKLNRKKTL